MSKVEVKHGVWKDGILWNSDSPGKLVTSYDPEIKTLNDVVVKAVKEFADRPGPGKREKLETKFVEGPGGKKFEKFVMADKFDFLTYGEWGDRISLFGKGMRDFTGAAPKDRFLIYAETQMDWMTAAMAGWRHSLQVVTAYATLGADGAAFAINRTQSAVVVADAKLLKVLLQVQPECPCLKYIVTIEACEPGIKKSLADVGIQVASFEELIARGKSSDLEDAPPAPEDIAVIMFTSGTTGQPKGVLITHENLVCSIAGLKPGFDRVSPPVGTTDSYCCYLPLAHIMEILGEITMLTVGCALGYGSPHTLTDTGVKLAEGCTGDLKVLKPTVVVFAPLVLEKIYNAISLKFGKLTGVKALLRDWGLASGKANFKKNRVGSDWLYNTILFSKVQGMTGGKLRYVITGSAPLDGNVHQFIQTCLNCPVRQGYGATETCAASCVQDPGHNAVANVGPPRASCCVKLEDWEEGGYKFVDQDNPEIGMPRGEILIGGPMITNGYLVDGDSPDPELVKKNAEEFTEDKGIRYFHTGDIGAVHPDGTISIIDRKKDLVKLQNGEYVALSKVEGVCKLAQLVENCMVHVDPSQPYCTVLVCPMAPALTSFAKEKGLGDDAAALCENDAVKQEVMNQIKAAAKGKLARFEIPTKCFLVPPDRVWTPENDLLTAAQKLKRKPIINFHADDIASLYKE